MVASRRAAPDGASHELARALRFAASTLAFALGGSLEQLAQFG